MIGVPGPFTLSVVCMTTDALSSSCKRRLTAAYHIGGFCEMLGVPEVLGLMSTSASGHYSSPSVGGILER